MQASLYYVSENSGNPNPKKYKIKKSKHIGSYVLIFINYPDCNNYEGDKILVYRQTTFDDSIEKGYLDPHFSENAPSPLARFEPTDAGWQMAIDFAKKVLSD
jgi:hypothetical protein